MHRSAIVATLAAVVAGPAFAQQMVVEPFLQSATPSDLWVVWETDAGDESRVEYGSTVDLGEEASGTSIEGYGGSQVHEVQLIPLDPGTRYYYRVNTGDLQGEVLSFRTPPEGDSEEPTRLVAMSDMQRDSGNPDKYHEVVHDGVIAHLQAEVGGELEDALAMVLVPGDLVDNGWSYDQWAEEFFDPCAALAAHVPLYPALGNHEANTPYYFRYFHLPDNGTEGFEEHWWYLDHSNVRVIGLDSNFQLEEQLSWLEGVLDEACGDPQLDFVFVQLHHPYLSELWPPGETDYTGDVIDLMDQFTADCGKPAVHFFGHTHGYSRGQSRDHAHLWVNVASAGGNIDYWGEYSQIDYPEFSVSQDEYGFVVVEVEAGDDPQMRLQRYSRGNEDVPRDNELRDEVLVRRFNNPPETPVGLWPASDTVSPDCVRIAACPYLEADGDDQGATHWQVSADCADFGDPLVERIEQHENWYMGQDLQAGNALTDEQVADLSPEASYCWRVRFRDRSLGWSGWSEPQPFTTSATVLVELPLLNAGAEDGTEGWTVTAGVLESLTDGECDGTSPRTGDRYFSVGGLCEGHEYGEANQSVDVGAHAPAIDKGIVRALFEGYLSSWGGDDRPEMELVFRDVDGVELQRSERIGTSATSWTLVQGEAVVPTGTRAIDLVLMGTRNAGVDNDSYVDDLRLRLDIVGEIGCDDPPDDLDVEALCPDEIVGDDDDDSAADDDDSAPATDDDPDGKGCGCRQTGAAAGLWTLAALAGLLLGLRRR